MRLNVDVHDNRTVRKAAHDCTVVGRKEGWKQDCSPNNVKHELPPHKRWNGAQKNSFDKKFAKYACHSQLERPTREREGEKTRLPAGLFLLCFAAFFFRKSKFNSAKEQKTLVQPAGGPMVISCLVLIFADFFLFVTI